jgi:glycerol-3-phosphate dehydrogenase
MPHPAPPAFTRRHDLFATLAQCPDFDVAVVGGGATGLGVALDAAARGFTVVLLESHDFAHGTSSRSTKLVHGGVRYLAQGNLGLVIEALHERATLLRNAPHLAQALPFVVPAYHWWETPWYGLGLKLYDVLAGASGLGRTRLLSRLQTLALLPAAQPQGLRGGIQYWDGQFDDARLALALARTAAAQGALLINACRVTGLTYADGKIAGLMAQDTLTGERYPVAARCVINATGVWVDGLRQHDGQAHPTHHPARPTRPMVAPSQGVHLVVDRSFLGGDAALMVPRTADGRVLFAVPWLGQLILGTTDTPRHDLPREPLPFKEEIDFILSESGRYLHRPPTRSDVKSVWVGLRPLVKLADDEGDHTQNISREHTVRVSRSGLVSVTGGKWTTYRAMADDVLRTCARASLLPSRPGGLTVDWPLVGAPLASMHTPPLSQTAGLHTYGSEQMYVQQLPGADTWLAPGLSEAMVRFAARHEYAIRVEDVLARRSRLLFLDARLAAALAPRVGAILQEETGIDPDTAGFQQLTQQYSQLP